MPSCSATSASTSARSRTPSANFGGWLLSQEHTRVGVHGFAAGDATQSLLQFSVPVHVANKLRPAFEPDMVVGINRLPRRPNRLAPQRHTGFAECAVGLALVARHACQHAVRPARHAAVRPRNKVI